MSFSYAPFFPQTLISYGLANAACTVAQNVIAGGVNGTKVETMIATSNDTIDHLLTFSLNVNGTLYSFGSMLVVANTGNLITSQNGVNILTGNAFPNLPLDPNGNRYLYIANASCGISVTSNSLNSAAHAVVTVSGQGVAF